MSFQNPVVLLGSQMIVGALKKFLKRDSLRRPFGTVNVVILTIQNVCNDVSNPTIARNWITSNVEVASFIVTFKTRKGWLSKPRNQRIHPVRQRLHGLNLSECFRRQIVSREPLANSINSGISADKFILRRTNCNRILK